MDPICHFFRVQMALGAHHMSHYWELLGGVKHVLFSTLIGMIQIVFFTGWNCETDQAENYLMLNHYVHVYFPH